MNRLQVFLLASTLSFHALSADSSFKNAPAVFGGWSCDVALQHLKSNSGSSNRISGWIAGYLYAKNIQFQQGKSPASGSEYEQVLLPHLSDYCVSNNSATFADALDSYIGFKINKGEAAFGN